MLSIITRPCNQCQEPYQAEQRYLNRGQGLFCSQKCSGLFSGNNKKEIALQRNQPNTKCGLPSCGIMFYKSEARKKNVKSKIFFCSKEHQISAYKLHLVVTGPDPESLRSIRKRKTLCKCGNVYVREGILCSSCKEQAIIDQWLDGNNTITIYGKKTKETKPFVKKYLIQTRGDKCEKCGFSEKAPDGRSIIQMDHIDGNYMNNDPSNLQLLCPNHHAMTPNYGSLNKNGGRAHRRKQQI